MCRLNCLRIGHANYQLKIFNSQDELNTQTTLEGKICQVGLHYQDYKICTTTYYFKKSKYKDRIAGATPIFGGGVRII